MRQIRIHLAVALYLLVAAGLVCGEEARTSLIIAGGGILPTNTAIFDRLIAGAKVGGRTRIGILPTASATTEAALRFAGRLVDRGVPAEQVLLIDMIGENASRQAENPAVIEQIRNCTAIVFSGGDQRRITRALLKPDGSASAALEAIRDVAARGGVLLGSSAGAAVFGEAMISVSGLPIDSLDEGMDALDFGLARGSQQPARRGLLVARGLGFFRGGIVDQHFSEYRGRLGRLARAVIEEQIRFGFGVDENTALAVSTDGTVEVLGAGHVTVVDSTGASCRDGPLGCALAGIRLTCLQHGDRFDPKTGLATVHPAKQRIEPGQEEHNGNFLIPDIAGEGAVVHALFSGLANNTSSRQLGITLKHHQAYAHGYRFTFLKSDQTRSFEGIVDGIGSGAVTNVVLSIEPVALSLRPPESALPVDLRDLPQGPVRTVVETIWFRGIMLADRQDRFRPEAAVTRGELASAIRQTIHLQPARGTGPAIADVDSASSEGEDVALVVAAGLMIAEQGLFRPGDSIARQEAATILVRLAERYRSVELPATPGTLADGAAISPEYRRAVFAAHRASLLKQDAKGIRPQANLTRQEVAEALYRIVGFPW